MSSSTVTKPYITESWIHMQKHGFNEKKPPEDGKYARSTASSRSRVAKEEDGMSQSGIHEAFAEAEDRFDKQQHQKSMRKPLLNTRRKSTTTIDVKKTVNSPRLNVTTTKKTPNESSLKPKSHLQSRRQTLSGAFQSTTPVKRNVNTTNINGRSASISVSAANQQGGLVKLADTFRDTLAEKRQELLNTNNKSRNTEVNDMITNAKRRSSMTKERLRSLEQPTRRTGTNGSGLQSLPSSPQTKPTEASYMKSTLADQQRRHSLAVTRTTSSPRRKKNNAIQHKAESPFQSEDDRESPVAVGISAIKRRSILAAATAKARQQQQQCPDLATNGSSGDEKPTGGGTAAITKNAPVRMRKKSLGLLDVTDRRMSRTESLKEGLPTSPSMMAARMSRRKSVIKQESPINPEPNSKRWSGTDASKKRGQRKRGQTLPGNLAKPPTVQSLQLPPMKLEPIKLTIPKTTNKSPSSVKSTMSTQLKKKRISLSSNTTPIPSSSSSSSPVKKSLSTRKAKGASHLGIPSSRRASLKAPSSTQVVTPPLKSSPTSIASPRVRPTRRQSVFERSTVTKSSQEESEYSGQRKLSSAYASNSRKNSLAEETFEKDKGRHRVISLQEKLESLVAQHTIHHHEDTDKRRLSPLAYDNQHLHRRFDPEDKYSMLSPEERARPQRIKDTLMMWDKEMVEAFSPGVPKSPSIAIKFYGHHLSPFEQNEIQGYPEVYFVGHHAKKHQAMPDASALNYGYDDERGDYKSVIGDHLSYRYEVLEELGRGSFGQVVKCYDHKTASTVAVKLIRNKKRFYTQAKTEVKILKDLVKWDPEDRHHNVKMTDSFYFRSHLCIVCECLSMNLYEFIKINNFQGFHLTLIKRFTIQLLRSLSLLSRHGVVHCDLKPENILLKHPTKSTIKVIDFGSSCLESQRVYTYIQSRFYRSPEIILGLDYTMAIDMWSLGCIIAELYTGIPIFPGENEQEQLACIMEVLGVPDPALIQLSERRSLFFDRRGDPRVVCNSRGKKRRAGTKSLSQALRCHDVLFLDFIQQCLTWDPTKRLTPERAFQHEWIVQSSSAPKPTTNTASPQDDPQQQQQQQQGSPKPCAVSS